MRGQRRRPARHWTQCLATTGCGDWSTWPTTIIRLSLSSPEPTLGARWGTAAQSIQWACIPLAQPARPANPAQSLARGPRQPFAVSLETLVPSCCLRSLLLISWALIRIMCCIRKRHDMHDYPSKWGKAQRTVGRTSAQRCTGQSGGSVPRFEAERN